MSNGNTVTLIGNATRDPELRFTPSGAAVVSFGIACNRRWQNKQSGEWEEAVSFFDIVAWRELGENVAETIEKGARVIVYGRLEQQSWTDEKTGDKRYKIQVVADEVAPSLRWATAQVRKVERNAPPDPQGSSRRPPQDDEEPF